MIHVIVNEIYGRAEKKVASFLKKIVDRKNHRAITDFDALKRRHQAARAATGRDRRLQKAIR